MTVIYGVAGTDGRALVRPLLAAAARKHWGWPALPPVERSPRGKPLFPGQSDHWFSLSHCGRLALCSLSDSPVGVDIELVRPRRPGLPAYALSGDELSRFDGSWEDFYRLWTLKESWCKREDAPLFPPPDNETPPPGTPPSDGGGGVGAAVGCGGPPPPAILWLELEALSPPPALTANYTQRGSLP